jgi:IPT/TIG domain-containing protein
MGPPRLARLCLGAAFVVGCVAAAPVPTVEGVTPLMGYNDRALRLVIHGEGFIPSYRLDPVNDTRRGDASGFSGQLGTGPDAVPLRDFDWLDTSQLTAWMDAGLPAGSHPLQIRDPRGQTATLSAAFLSLGPDRTKPVVQFVRPTADTPLAPGSRVSVSLIAADPAPGALASLSWETTARNATIPGRPCALLPSPGLVMCDFEVSVPSSLDADDAFDIIAMAVDRAAVPNRTRQPMHFVLRPRPSLESIEPVEGGTAGGTDVVVSGSGFVPGTRVLVDGTPLVPDGGTLIDEQTISGRMPPHPAATVAVTVVAPLGEGNVYLDFSYADPPAILAVNPEKGDPVGGTTVRITGLRFNDNTQVLFGDTLAEAQPLVSPQLVRDMEISGSAPAGKGRTSVWVFDSALGWDVLVDGFGWSVP